MKPKNIVLKPPEKKFYTFSETFRFCAFALAIALIYPNKNNIIRRWITVISVIFFNSVILFWFVSYLIKCLISVDIYNFARTVTVGVVVVLFLFKSFYVNWKNEEFEKLLNKISKDLLKGNYMDEDYQRIYEYHIKQAKIPQICWLIIPTILSLQFPLYASTGLIYETLNSDVGKKYMVFEMQLKYIEDKQYVSPYYEIIFAYSLVPCLILVPNFAGFDSSFCIATTHMRLKLKLMTHKVHRAFKDARNRSDLQMKVKEAIKDHQEALEFHRGIQEVYGGWLLAVFLLTSFLISFNIYQIYISKRIDPKYAIFTLNGVLHMYMPCYFASSLIKVNEELSTDLYNASWEDWADPAVTKLLVFMMAKSQQRLVITGKRIVVYNMDLFISILHMSYSFFTLITAK
uniref:Odorant receptor n=1 Tax=Streltzoviella insularis TaxID=1206366 RepID=A0A7D5YRL1_9NEOP|nr:odorant receptor 3 [Streltzoviella insularis]